MFRAFVVLVLSTAVVSAQPSSQSTKLFDEGRELAKQQKWAEACEKFQQSLVLDAAPGTKLNLGDCLEKQGKIREGWLIFEEAARDFERMRDPRAKFAHDRAAAASARLATLVIKVSDPGRTGLTIRIDDRVATPQAEIVERVDPGPYTVAVTAPDAESFSVAVTAAAGKVTVVDIPVLASRGAGTAPPPQETPRAVEPSDPRRRRVKIAATLGIVGGAALVGSGLLGLFAKAQYDAAIDNECFADASGERVCTEEGKDEVDAAGTKADVATAIAIVGAGLAATAVILYVTAPKRGDRISVAPIASSSSVGVVLGGRF